VLAVLFFIFGSHLIIVPVVNTTIAILLLIVLEKWLAGRAVHPVIRLTILLAIVLLVPISVLVLYGMEKPLLLLLAVIFLSRMVNEWNKEKISYFTLLCGAMMVATRYDGTLLVFVVTALLMFQRRPLAALEVCLWGMLPILIFGFLGLSKGGYFVPNSILIEPLKSSFSLDWLWGCALAMSVPMLSRRKLFLKSQTVRYAFFLSVVVIVLAVSIRNVYALKESDNDSLQVSRQYYPLGRFFHRYYNREAIASNDVGVISYLTDGKYLDLSGLASSRLLSSKIGDSISQGMIHLLGQQQYTQLAVISDNFKQSLPDSWIKTASWTFPGYDLSLPERTFFFYAMDSTRVPFIVGNLKEYSHFLPSYITVHYFSTFPKLPKE